MVFLKNSKCFVCLIFVGLLFSDFCFAINISSIVKEKCCKTIPKNKTKSSLDSIHASFKRIPKKDLGKFLANGFVSYSDFGAKGDGKTDDIIAIVATHEFANKNGLKVKADDAATYYISGKQHTAAIQTNTDFGLARFIIDDTNVQNAKASVFEVSSKLNTFSLNCVLSVKKNQQKINVKLAANCVVIVTNSAKNRYIRFGLNQNNGFSQTDIFMIDKHGKVNANTPILWDFDTITKIEAFPVDEEVLKITGGRFTTIANQEVSKYNYYQRNISIKRSNVIVDGLIHEIVGEENQGAPYGGFLFVKDCANVTIQNTVLTGHKTYKTIGNAGKPVSMGTYDLQINRALNVLIYNCTQTNDINDTTFWGIMASNYSKNLTYNRCVLSRFDAHMGVYNATIRNSTLGYAGINLIGFGNFILENSKIYSKRLINLRQDYGSTWQGNFTIRDCVFVPTVTKDKDAVISLFIGFNNGQHNFGYTCYMPKRITIKNLFIDDSKHATTLNSIAIFDDFNPDFDAFFTEKNPYIKTKKVVLNNVTSASGNSFKISKNLYMFQKIKLLKK